MELLTMEQKAMCWESMKQLSEQHSSADPDSESANALKNLVGRLENEAIMRTVKEENENVNID